MRLPFPEEKPKRISPDEPMPTASYEQAREWMLRQTKATLAEIEEEVEKIDVMLGIGAFADDEERETWEEVRALYRQVQDALLDALTDLREGRTREAAAKLRERFGDPPGAEESGAV